MRHDLLQLAETAVEEMLAAGNDDDRQVLRTCPFQNRGERNDIVLIAVHDQRILGYRFGIETINRRRDQGESLGRKLAHDPCLHIRTEGEAGEQDGQIAEAFAQMLDQNDQIVGFAYALIVNALGCAHPTEVRSCRAIPEAKKCARERSDHFVLASPPLQGMWVRDKCDATARRPGIVQRNVDRPGRAIDQRLSERRWAQELSLARRARCAVVRPDDRLGCAPG